MALIKLSEKARNTVYGAGLIGTGAAVIAQSFGVIDGASSSSIVQLITIVGGLLGVGAAGTAGSVLKDQRQNGAVIGDVKLPEPPPLSAVEHVATAVQQVQELDNQVRGGLGKLTEITGGLINIPGMLAMTPELPGQLDDMIRGAGERYKRP